MDGKRLHRSLPGPQTPQRGGTLRFAPLDSLTTLDPLRYLTAADLYLASTVYEKLVAIDATDPAFPVVPRLAESWEVAEDGLVWTFHLRHGGGDLPPRHPFYGARCGHYLRTFCPPCRFPTKTLSTRLSSLVTIRSKNSSS